MQARLIKQEAERCLVNYRIHSTTMADDELSSLSKRAISLFFEFYQSTRSPLRESIEFLCEINASPNPNHVSIGLEALFPNLIEKLNDAFLPSYCKLYDRVFSQVISFFRQLPSGQQIDSLLSQFGLNNEASILRHKQSLNRKKNPLASSRPLKKIILLSRVTIGADIAVTSVIMAHLKKRYPDAELILLSSPKLQQLYGGDPQIRVRPIHYGRGSTILARVETWLQVTDAIKNEIAGLRSEEYCVIDPDSRLTQLGLLPVLPKESEANSYFFFASRSYSHPVSDKLGQLASHWISEICGDSDFTYPFLCLQADDPAITKQVFHHLKSVDNRPTICISFGVGGNPIKRLSDEFELNLVLALVKKARLIIDYGATIEEHNHIDRILSVLAANGQTITKITDLQLPNQAPNPFQNVFTWRGDIGTFASLIANSNLYIGYDSAGQHIATALNVPTLTIFINSGSNSFPLRWQPHGAGTIKTIHLSPSRSDINSLPSFDLISRVLDAQEQLLLT